MRTALFLAHGTRDLFFFFSFFFLDPDAILLEGERDVGAAFGWDGKGDGCEVGMPWV